jgi:hypothetical protein
LERSWYSQLIYPPLTGVVTSCGVYLKLTGYIFVSPPTPTKDGLSGRIPRPFVVVHSGKTQIMLSGFWATRSARETRFVGEEGTVEGGAKARRMARKREMRSTRRVEG